jgi:hypothetical protein
VIVANKWDAVEKNDKTYDEAVKYIKDALFPVAWAEVRHFCQPRHVISGSLKVGSVGVRRLSIGRGLSLAAHRPRGSCLPSDRPSLSCSVPPPLAAPLSDWVPHIKAVHHPFLFGACPGGVHVRADGAAVQQDLRRGGSRLRLAHQARAYQRAERGPRRRPPVAEAPRRPILPDRQGLLLQPGEGSAPSAALRPPVEVG